MRFIFDQCLIFQERIRDLGQELNGLREYFSVISKMGGYDNEESFINLPADQDLFDQLKQTYREKVTPALKYFINIGIGGSNLGAKAIYDCLLGNFDLVETERFPKMLFADTTDPEYLHSLSGLLKSLAGQPERVLFNVISKSGTTTETMANLGILESVFPAMLDRLVVTTAADTPLWRLARELKITTLPAPSKVAGRYSVFSAAGLFPLLGVGVDIDSLALGAAQMTASCLSADIGQNGSLTTAALIFLHYREGRAIHDQFFFHPEMESLGKWYRQLLAESVGKEKDRDGKVISVGVTPTVSLGSTDLHSMAQLYFSRPLDRLTNFVWSEKNKNDVFVSDSSRFAGLVPNIGGKSAKSIMRAILDGVKASYGNKQMPYTETVLLDLSPHSLGEWLQFQMFTVFYLAKLFNVNPFDQSEVEEYKKETKRRLENS